MMAGLTGVVGLGLEAWTASRDARSHPAPGRLVDVGGYRLHLYCTGPPSRAGAPTVILEGMSGGSVPHWAWVQPALARQVRVCSYDRAGYGWSDLGTGPRDLARAAADLHRLVEQAGERGPFTVAGHSLGGLIVRQYAFAHSEEVSALVLIDASHPQQFIRHPEYRADMGASAGMIRMSPVAARFGLLRLYVRDNVDFGGLPPEARDALMASWSATKHWRAEAAALAAFDAFFEQAQGLSPLGNLPITVVTAGRNDLPGWVDLQSELATLSSDTVHLTIDDATHASLALDAAHAGRVSDAIRLTAERSRPNSN
jgi:pimeloyl-ACP methyl ester carboxylesterase